MRGRKTAVALLTALILSIVAQPVVAQQCVPFARQNSEIFLRGDAWRWWNAADGRYEKGATPQIGSVLVFKKHGKMQRGHVAVVTQIIHGRKVLVDHANWQPSGRGKGRVSTGIAVLDISPKNDWTQVKVWYEPVKDYGDRTYPTYGFIYPGDGPSGDELRAISISFAIPEATENANVTHQP